MLRKSVLFGCATKYLETAFKIINIAALRYTRVLYFLFLAISETVVLCFNAFTIYS